ncbi:uncharacterized protein [Procambarus clarkii]|uniref:uncharacterized protein n=1 Tax=Procambarus clarkii TaxID=6728 RepID=UPI001E670499|nr:uncharacterized protein LOC123774484 [Procambarus clarkii]
MTRGACPTLVLLAALLTLAASQGFYSQRYGKRSDTREVAVRSGLYVNRNGRSTLPQGLPEIKIRSSRFIGGSRYGKRSGSPPESEFSSAITPEADDTDMTATLLLGDSVLCFLVDVPDIYRCLKKPASEEANN